MWGIGAALDRPERRLVGNDPDMGQTAQPAEVGGTHLNVDPIGEPQLPRRARLDQLPQNRKGGKRRLGVIEHDVSLPLISGND